MYLEENIRRLKETGLTGEELKRIKKGKWLIEHCYPEDVFLLKLAYLLKTRRPPLYRIIEGSNETVKHFERNFGTIMELFCLRCESASEEYMKKHFRKFLYIPRNKLDRHHFKTLLDFMLFSGYPPSNICSIVDFEVSIFGKTDLFLYTLYMYECGVMWMGGKERMWFFAGPLVEEDLERMVEGAQEFSRRIFSSEWWRKLSEVVPLAEMFGSSLGEYIEKVERLKEIKDWFETLSELKPVLLRLKKVPLDFTSQITAFYAQLLEEYLKM